MLSSTPRVWVIYFCSLGQQGLFYGHADRTDRLPSASAAPAPFLELRAEVDAVRFRRSVERRRPVVAVRASKAEPVQYESACANGVRIGSGSGAYPGYNSWVESSGKENADWYNNK